MVQWAEIMTISKAIRVLLDTDVLQQQNTDHVTSENLREILKIIGKIKAEIIIHPVSFKSEEVLGGRDIKGYLDREIKTYTIFDSSKDPNEDPEYLALAKNVSENNDDINIILYPVYKDLVDFLITENISVHKKASRLGIDDRVLLIEEALRAFRGYLPEYEVVAPLPLKNKLVKDLDLGDPIFDTLKRDYPEFESWFEKISDEGRDSWVYYRNDGKMGALLIYKVEDEPIDSNPLLEEKKRLKISTLKVTHVGYKIGELFIKLVVDICVKNNISEVYLTHFTEEEDRLVELITEYGFERVGVNSRGEEIFIKKLIADRDEARSLPPIEISKRFYPSFYDGEGVKKFVVPIRPEYHSKLFTDFPERQTTLLEHMGEFIIEGNTIKKAYITHSRIKKMRPGDIILFYQSEDLQAITSIGVVESVHTGIEDGSQIVKLAGKRTVFSRDKIDEWVKRPVSVFLFRHHFHLKRPLPIDELTAGQVLTAAPQSVTEITREDYKKLKEMGGFDGRFTID